MRGAGCVVLLAAAPLFAQSSRLLRNTGGANDSYRSIGRLNASMTCTAAFIRTAPGEAAATAPAYAVTSGHCAGSLGRNDVVLDRTVSGAVIFDYFVDTQDRQYRVPLRSVRWASQKGVDLAVIELAATAAELEARGYRPWELAAQEPGPSGQATVIGAPLVTARDDSYLRAEDCSLGPRTGVIENFWHSFDAVRTTCRDIFSGSSGSPVITDGRIAAVIFTTANQSAPGTDCWLGAPCEVSATGYRSDRTLSYASSVAGLGACFESAGRFDISLEKCPLDPGRQVAVTGLPPLYTRPVVTGPGGERQSVTWAAALAGGTLTHYRYKVVRAGAGDCRDPEGYGPVIALESGARLDISVPETEGWQFLCLLGGRNSTVDQTWQQPRFATVANIYVDVTPPAMPPRMYELPRTDVYWVQYGTLAPELADYRVKWGAPAEVDCADPQGYARVPPLNIVRLPRAGGPYRLCTIALDTAGNQGRPAATVLAEGEWHTRAPYPIEVTEVSGAAIGDEIFTLCGITPAGSSRALFIYDVVRDRWREGAPIPIEPGADHCNVAAVGGYVYLLGAVRAGGALDSGTYRYDPRADRWERIAAMPTARGASGVAAIGARIYVAGGLAASGSVRAFEVFDTAASQWSRLPDMPTARDHLTSQAANGRFYAISGRDGGNLRAETEEYDPGANVWRARAPIPVPRGGIGSGVTTRSRIVVFGGEGPSGTPERTFAAAHAYDPAADTWTALPSMPTPRHGLYGIAHEGRVFAPGGGPREGATFSSAHEVWYPEPASPPAIRAVGNAASSAAAVAPGAIVSIYGENLSTGAQIASRALSGPLNATVIYGASVDRPPLALYYAGPNQVNAHIPYDASGASITLFPVNAGVIGEGFSVPLVPAAPAIFAAVPASAARGDVIEIYCTGLGRVRREGDLDVTVERPEVTIGGTRAEVLFSGISPGSPGLYQVNVRIPAESRTGTAVPVTLSISGAAAETAIAVR